MEEHVVVFYYLSASDIWLDKRGGLYEVDHCTSDLSVRNPPHVDELIGFAPLNVINLRWISVLLCRFIYISLNTMYVQWSGVMITSE